MESVLRTRLGVAVALLVAIAALHFGRPVLMPLALGLLVSFVLAPVAHRLERLGLGRAPSVIAVVLLVVALLVPIGMLVARQASSLADDYPKYRVHLREKMDALRGPIGSVSGAAQELDQLGAAVQQKTTAPKVQVVEPPHAIGTLAELLSPLVGALGTVGLAAVFAIFLLFEREELRDRLLWLTGAQHLSLATDALDDATRRVSRYLGMQTLVCSIYGSLAAVGLALIGIPGALVFGALAAMLRFLPYFGPWIGAGLPSLLATALPGWEPALLTVAFMVVLELVTNNVLEPWLYGASVGLSPFAVVFSAVFWAWLWGIPGLLLATPLTVCLVVAGRYLAGLEWLAVLLGNQPALPPEVRLYQRLLAQDWDEAAELLREHASGATPEQLSDRMVLPMLRRLAHDEQRDRLPRAKCTALRERLDALLEDVAEPVAVVHERPRVLFVPALDETEALAGRWLARIARARGLQAEAVSTYVLSSEVADRAAAEADLVCISALTPRSIAQARRLWKRILAREAAEIWVGLWAAPPHERGDATTRWIFTAEALRVALDNSRARMASPSAPRPASIERAQVVPS